MKKVATGVKNLDRLLGGGIPEKQFVLVQGQPGAGKSNLGLEYLYRGAMSGEDGLLVSFQDTEDEILRTTTFDWQFEEMVEKDKITIENFDPYREEEMATMIRNAAVAADANRVFIDPITDLDLYIDSRKDIRKTLLDIKNAMSELGATTILTAEGDESTEIEEEVVDSIVVMETETKEDSLQRRIYVRKLEGSSFSQGVHPYEINSKGIKIL